MNLQTMTGLELMQAMAAGKLPKASIADTIPMEPVSAEAGRVVFHVCANDTHLNPLGGVHGGFAATVMDSATGCAVHTMLPPMTGYGTIDLNVKMVRPVPKHKTLIAEGKVINLSKSLGIAEGILKDEDGKVYAHSTASCMIQRPTD